MKAIKTILLVVFVGMLIPMLATNCKDKKNEVKAETAEATAKTESAIKVPLPPFQKFVVVINQDSGLYKNADINSLTLVRWIESDCESDFCEMVYQWSDQPAKPGFEISTDILTWEGRVFPVLGEEGQFYKVSILDKWCDIESAYIPKECVGDIEVSPINADLLNAEETAEIYFKCRMLKEDKYKDIVLLDEYDELEGETLKVGVLTDGVVATPFVYNFYCSYTYDQNEGITIDDSEETLNLHFNKSVATAIEEGVESYRIDLQKLSDEQIAKIIDTATKRKPEYVEFMYHFPAQGLRNFIYRVK